MAYFAYVLKNNRSCRKYIYKYLPYYTLILNLCRNVVHTLQSFNLKTVDLIVREKKLLKMPPAYSDTKTHTNIFAQLIHTGTYVNTHIRVYILNSCNTHTYILIQKPLSLTAKTLCAIRRAVLQFKAFVCFQIYGLGGV